MPPPASFTITRATPDAAPAIIEMIEALADFEHLRHELQVDAARLAADLAGPQPRIEAFIGSIDGTAVAYALTYRSYSTFLCRQGLFLEDLFVRPEWRRCGIGRHLLAYVIDHARQSQCGRVEWYVLDWNAPAIALYESMGAQIHTDWRVARIPLVTAATTQP